MTIDKQFADGKLTVAISGKLNTITSPQLDAELQDLSGVTELVLDLKNLEHISSAGLRVLLITQCIMNEQGKMIVKNVSEQVNDIFVLTGFTGFLTIE